MSEKGGSGLDIFKDLAKKPGTQPAAPAPAPPQGVRQKTLLGLQAPAGAFPPPGGRPSGPPPLQRPASLPPPPPSRRSGPPPPPPPAMSSGNNPRPPGPSLAPPPASFGGNKPPAPAVDMDWDDEDEKTSIYDKDKSDDPRQLLAPSAPPVPPPAAGMPPPSMPPPARVPAPPTRPVNRPPVAPPPVVSMASAPMPAAPPFAPVQDRKSSLYIAIAALALALAVVGFAFWPRVGSLVITVSGPGNKPLDAVEILVNGEKKCTLSPCTLDNLKADTYYVRAHAAGYQAMADLAVVVSAGQKAVQNLSLVRALGTGIKVVGEGTGLKLYVDGREVGPLPQEIKDMEPGQHQIKVAGSERFEPFERAVTVEPEQMQTIGPLKLRVLKGLATIVPGSNADGAKVILISGSDRRTLPKLPITLDIPTNQQHTLVATKHGFDQFKLPIKFDDGQVEKTFEVNLSEGGSSAASSGGAVASSSGGSRPSYSTAAAAAAMGVGESPAPAAPSGGGGGSATLNINSIPVSNILLDGRPVGPTPRVGLKVSAGSHTVVFVKGTDRKSASVSVGAGQTKTVAVRF